MLKSGKKIAAGILSAIMLCSAIPVASVLMAKDNSSYSVNAAESDIIYAADFEDGSVGKFAPRMNEGQSVVLSVETDSDAHGGSGCLKCSGREATWHGITCPADDLETGKEYMISASVKASWYSEIAFSIQYDDAGGTTHYENVKKVISQGEWQEFENVKFLFPKGAANRSFYFEAPTEAKSELFLDDFELKTAPVYEIEKDIPSLKDVFSPYFKFGGAATDSELANPSVQALIKKHYNSLTPGNELKPESLLDKAACQSQGNNVNPIISIDSARNILDFCRDNKIPVRGHVLVWHSQTPGWFFKENFDDNGDFVSKEIMLQRMENYIKNVMEALAADYPTVDFYAWDVVNEAWLDDGSYRKPGTYEEGNHDQSGWVQIFGDNSFIPYAFEYARKYAPEGCKLYYNDYNEYMPQKTEAIIKMAEELKAKNLIDGIGMQSHLDVRSGSDAFPSVAVYESAMKKFVDTGLDVQVTELDATVNDNSEASFKTQAEYYKGIIDACLKYSDNISAVVLWGSTDDKSWRASQYPLIFNEDFTAKPAYYSIIDDLEIPPTEAPTASEAPATTEALTTEFTGSDFLSGDVTGDKKINVFDSIALRRLIIMQSMLDYIPTPYPHAADVTGDGYATISDLVLLNQFLVGKDVKFKKYTEL